LLIVDEHGPSRQALLVGFTQRGYTCAAVGSEADALVAIATFDPHIVILEWANRGNLTGGIAARMRGRAAGALCIIVVSFADEPLGFRDREQVDAYLIKPALVDEIEDVLLALLSPAR
jgi:DNA-binding response OmpR family regulator